MAKKIINTPLLMKPIAHFSHAVRVDTLIHAGATAGTDAGRRLAGNSHGLVDVRAQTEQMFDNLETTLGLLDATVSDLVRLKVYVTDLRDLPHYAAVFHRRYGSLGVVPSVVGSFGFPLPQAAIELDAVAITGTKTQPIAHSGGSGAMRAGSRLYATAHPTTADGALVTSNGKVQSAAALAQLAAILSKARMGMPDVVNLHITLADVRDIAAFEQVFSASFTEPRPSATVVVAPLPHPFMRVQLEAVCVAGGGRAIMIDEGGTALASASDAMLVQDELYISAQTGVRNDGGSNGRADLGQVDTVVETEVEAQTRLAWKRVHTLLEKAGMRFDDVLRTNNVLTDWRHYGGFNVGYGASTNVPYPNRATVLGALRDPNACVHVEAIAHRNANNSTVVEANGHE
jgi:enamine deaminase RidA (YjgF/YER057c/UK114 family)